MNLRFFRFSLYSQMTPFMHCFCSITSKCCRAVFALEWFFSSMDIIMFYKFTFIKEAFATRLTFVRSLVNWNMCLHMILQSWNNLATFGTLEFQMNIFKMLVQFRFTIKHLSTLSAWNRIFTDMKIIHVV